MSYAFVEYLGAFVRWLFKGCRSKLKDEIEGNFNAKWGKSYNFEDLIIGELTLFALIVVFFLIYIR